MMRLFLVTDVIPIEYFCHGVVNEHKGYILHIMLTNTVDTVCILLD